MGVDVGGKEKGGTRGTVFDIMPHTTTDVGRWTMPHTTTEVVFFLLDDAT